MMGRGVLAQSYAWPGMVLYGLALTGWPRRTELNSPIDADARAKPGRENSPIHQGYSRAVS